MARFKKVLRKKNEGKITYSNDIVDNIVYVAVSELDNVELSSPAPNKKMKSSAIKVTFDKGLVHIDVTVKIHFNQNVSEMAFKIQETVRHNVESMTEYTIGSVNVNVNGITFGEQVSVQNN